MKKQLLSLMLLCVTSYGLAEKCKRMSVETLQLLENVIEEIYHLNTQEVQAIVNQDFGCIPNISADGLMSRMEQEDDLIIINVLSEKWYKDCHISGSINVPLNELIYHVQDWDRDANIVVYCALDACNAGEKAYVLLRCMGFENIVDYHGGIREWFQLGYQVEGPCASSYLYEQPNDRCLRMFDIPTDFKSVLRETKYIKRFKARCEQGR